MKKEIGKKTASTVPVNAACENGQNSSAITSPRYLGGEEESHFEDTIFLKGKVLKLAVSKTYLTSKPKLKSALASNKHFAVALMKTPECDDGASFIKAGGFQKDGSFISFYALLWNGRSIVSSDISIEGGAISFLCPSARYCSSFQDMANSTAVPESVSLSLGKAALAGIKETCVHWDNLFAFKSDVLGLKQGHTKESLNFDEVGEGDGVWNRNQDVDGLQEIIDMSFHWCFPVQFHRKIWWSVG